MFRRFLFVFAGMAGLVFSALPASAKIVSFVQCPGAKMQREITTPLPSGWWQTPIVVGLKATEIQTIGGKATLVCRYGAAGQIMHLRPKNQMCKPVQGGFQCHPPLGPQPPQPPQAAIHAKGHINLPQGARANLDTGTVGGGGGTDLWYRAVNPLVRFLGPVNGATMWVGGATPQGKAGCASGPFAGNKVPLLLVPPGTHVCLKTGQGRISEFRINGFGGTTMSLSYTTWN